MQELEAIIGDPSVKIERVYGFEAYQVDVASSTVHGNDVCLGVEVFGWDWIFYRNWLELNP